MTARTPYNRVYWYVPHWLPESRRADLYHQAALQQVTVGPSADDAGNGDGLSSRKAVLWDLPIAEHGEYRAWFDRWYPGTVVSFAGKTSPEPPPPPPPKEELKTLVGLHSRADGGDLPEADFREFADLRPGAVKILSSIAENSLNRLAAENSPRLWIVRAYLSFDNNRVVTPAEFVKWTILDVLARVKVLRNRGVPDRRIVLELHNEPNLSTEGLLYSWLAAAHFSSWIDEVRKQYRRAFPDNPLCWPGLSPGASMTLATHGICRQRYMVFLRECIDEARRFDYIGAHAYWGKGGGTMEQALQVVHNTAALFPNHPVLVTEASNNSARFSAQTKAAQYVQFAKELGARGLSVAVTYFVCSATNPEFAPEVWAGNGIGGMVGRAI